MIADIYKRTKTLSQACLKIALVLPQDKVLCNLTRNHLIDKASEMAIKSKGLMITQNPEYFLKKLSEAKEATDGCQYWLELIRDENYLDSSIIDPIFAESESISHLFALAIRKIKPNNY
jgi:hypothetical protein